MSDGLRVLCCFFLSVDRKKSREELLSFYVLFVFVCCFVFWFFLVVVVVVVYDIVLYPSSLYVGLNTLVPSNTRLVVPLFTFFFECVGTLIVLCGQIVLSGVLLLIVSVVRAQLWLCARAL